MNLIGEHTDYNQGFVLPMALPQATWIALRPRHDRTVRLISETEGEESFDLDHLRRQGSWFDYVAGVAWALDVGRQRGWEGTVTTDLPVGAGLSSSAALEVAASLAVAVASDMDWDPLAAAAAGRQAENEWVGVPTGVMDQLASAASRAEHAMLIDCRSMTIDHRLLPPGVVVAVLDTGTRRRLVGSEYRERREACERAAAALGVGSLREATLEMLAAAALDEVTARRALHVITENQRVLDFVASLARGEVSTAGRLLTASHRSLQDNFEVSGPALDAMVEAALAAPGVLGARLTGAGFAGCAVALVEEGLAEVFSGEVTRRYRQVTDAAATVTWGRPAAGASVEG